MGRRAFGLGGLSSRTISFVPGACRTELLVVPDRTFGPYLRAKTLGWGQRGLTWWRKTGATEKTSSENNSVLLALQRSTTRRIVVLLEIILYVVGSWKVHGSLHLPDQGMHAGLLAVGFQFRCFLQEIQYVVCIGWLTCLSVFSFIVVSRRFTSLYRIWIFTFSTKMWIITLPKKCESFNPTKYSLRF